MRDLGMPKLRQDDADYSEEETERRMNAALKRALNTPPKPRVTKEKAKEGKPRLRGRGPGPANNRLVSDMCWSLPASFGAEAAQTYQRKILICTWGS